MPNPKGKIKVKNVGGYKAQKKCVLPPNPKRKQKKYRPAVCAKRMTVYWRSMRAGCPSSKAVYWIQKGGRGIVDRRRSAAQRLTYQNTGVGGRGAKGQRWGKGGREGRQWPRKEVTYGCMRYGRESGATRRILGGLSSRPGTKNKRRDTGPTRGPIVIGKGTVPLGGVKTIHNCGSHLPPSKGQKRLAKPHVVDYQGGQKMPR